MIYIYVITVVHDHILVIYFSIKNASVPSIDSKQNETMLSY